MGSRGALEAALAHGCRCLATKAVFWDMRQQWLEQLYRHHVSGPAGAPPPPFSTRIDPLLDGLNQVWGGGTVCACMHVCTVCVRP